MAAFTKAHWLIPDPITRQSSLRIAADSLAHRSYPTAPVSNLYVFGRIQDLAFELPTNDVQNRAHIRLWQTNMRLNGQPLWLGAATYDKGIELSSRTDLPTHHILPTVDRERDAVGADLVRSGLAVAANYEPFTSPIFVAFNGGGDYYASDGQALLVSLVRTQLPALTGLNAGEAAVARGVFRAYAGVTSVPLLAGVVVVVSAVIAVLALYPLVMWMVRKSLQCVKKFQSTDEIVMLK